MLEQMKNFGVLLAILGASTGTTLALPTPLTDRVSVEITQQNGVCKGVVKDHLGETIIGASVVVKGSTNGTITGLDGDFLLNNVKQGNIIQISYIGYITQEVVWQGVPLNIKLKEDSQTLDEVVVVGFGSQKKANLTGAVSQVKMDEVLGSRPVVNAMSALQGTMPGLQITANTDASGPGQSKKFNIRGTTSINGGDPLVLIDNVPGDIDMLNPEDIESISVLKDAASSAIYGARAAFGVILVTTKKAQKGTRFSVNYNNNFGFQKSINRPKIADGLQWMQAYLDAEFNSGKYPTGQDIRLWQQYLTEYRKNPDQFEIWGDGVYVSPEDGLEYYLNEKNIYNNMLDDFGFMQTHNASISGGTETLIYRMSVGYTDEQGILITDKDRYKRLSGSAFIQADITPWLNQSVDVRYAQSEKNMPVTSTRTGLYDMRLPSIYPEGTLAVNDGRELLTNTPCNILKLATDDNTVTDNARILSKTVLKPLKGWDIVFEYTFDKQMSYNRNNRAMYEYTSVEKAVMTTADYSSLETKNSFTDYNAINLYSTYRHSWNEKHNFSIMAGFNQESSNYRETYAKSLDMINEDFPSHNTGTNDTRTVTEKHTEYTVRGAFYRLNYDYEGKYLFEANGRYDGSSKFPKDDRFGFFPSFSLGWNMAREKFMEKTQDWLGEFKLRASWGQIGNQAIDPYQFTPLMESYKPGWIVGGVKPTSVKAPGLASSSFTWETVETLDFGFDLSMFGGRLHGTFDWYRRDTKDMLAPGFELPSVIGAAAPLQNTADLRTKGWELNLSWRDRIGDWGYTVGFNLYDSKTKVTKYNNDSYILFKSDGKNNFYEGYEIGTIWGYETDGFYTVEDFTDTQTWQLKEGVVTVQGVNPRPGDIKYKNLRDDANSTNQIDGGNGTLANPGDQKIIGNDALRMQYGINLGVDYKGFDLSILLQGVGKRDVWISDARRWPFASGKFGQIFGDQLDYWKPVDAANGNWQPVNSNPEFYRLYGEANNAGYNQRAQTKYLLNGAYLRIKNITLSYSFPKSLLSPISLNGLKAFVSCENLHTFHHLPDGYDPERLSWNYPFFRTISFGVNVTL